MNEIWLVRHGATEWSTSGRHTGRTDVPLLPEGRARAALLAPVLGAQAFALVLTSPLARASDTATLAGFGDAERCADLAEWDYGDVEGRTTDEMREQYPRWTVWDGPIPNGELIDDVAMRARRVLARADGAAGDVLLFAHGHVLRILTAIALELEPLEARRFSLAPATISVLSDERGTRAVERWNAPGGG